MNLDSLPGNVTIINEIREMHPSHGVATCPECGKPAPCPTNAYVNGLLSAR